MIIISKRTVGRFKEDEFSIGTTSKNNYYPFYSLFEQEQITDNSYIYYKPSISYHSYISRYSELFETIGKSMHFNRFDFTYDNESHFIYAMKGYITNDIGKTLFMLSINDYDNVFEGDKPKYSKFKVFVATEFITNPIYSRIWRKIDKEYIQECHNLGISVEFNSLDKLDSSFFSNEFKINFNNLSELSNHLENDVSKLLFEDVNYYPSFDDSTTEVISLLDLCENAIENGNIRLTVNNLHIFSQRYYVSYGFSPDNVYIKVTGNIVFVFNNDVNHEFNESQINDFLNNNFAPTPLHIDNIYDYDNIPHSLLEQNIDPINQELLDNSILITADSSDTTLSYNQLRQFKDWLNSEFNSGVRNINIINGEFEVILGDYITLNYDESEIVEIINSNVNEFTIGEHTLGSNTEEQSSDGFELIDDTEEQSNDSNIYT
jgi:hypothetical protein